MVSLPCCLMPRGKGRKRVKQTVEYRVARDEDMPRKLLEGHSPARSFRPLQNGIRQQGPSEGERNTAAHGGDQRLASAWQPLEAVWPCSRRGTVRSTTRNAPSIRQGAGTHGRGSPAASAWQPPEAVWPCSRRGTVCYATRNALSTRQGAGAHGRGSPAASAWQPPEAVWLCSRRGIACSPT